MIDFTPENPITNFWKTGPRTMADMQKEIREPITFFGKNANWGIFPIAEGYCLLCIITDKGENVLFSEHSSIGKAIEDMLDAEMNWTPDEK